MSGEVEKSVQVSQLDHPSPSENESSPEIDSPPTQEATNASVASATGVLALGNVASRLLGMAREVVLTNLFGASAATDAFFVATLIPRTLYDLLIGGHINGAIIPVLSEVITRDGKIAFSQLISVLLSLITFSVSLLVLVLVLFAPTVVGFVGSGYDAATQNLAVDLLRITAPALLFLSLFAILSGTLYALRSFTIPALAGAIFNGCVVLGTILLAPPVQVLTVIQSPTVYWTVGRPMDAIRAAAIGWLFGAFVQMALQFPGLRGISLRLTIHWRHPAVRQIVLLYVPVMFSLILDALVRVFSYNLASQTGERSLSYMNWATTLIQFPQGLVATAISIAILPTLARQSVRIAQDGERPFRDTLGLGLRMAITLIVPAAVGLFVLALPIIALLFQHGAFSATDSAITALALRLYLLGLPFAAVDLLLVYAFYARQDTVTPAVIGLVSLVVYMVVAVALLPTTGIFSLMIADSLKHITHATLSAYILHRRIGGFADQRLLQTGFKVAIAAALMGTAATVVEPFLERFINPSGIVGEVLLVSAGGGIAIIVYAVLAYLLGLQELRWLVRLIRQRFTGR